MSDNVIELNGKRYDAVTGAYLGVSSTAVVPAAPPARGRAVDGFIRPAHKQVHPKTTPKVIDQVTPKTVQARPKTPLPKAAAATAHRHAKAPHASAHKPEHAKTLMRGGLSKPGPQTRVKPQKPAEVMAKPASTLARKQSVAQVDPHRLARAQEVAKHQAVRRFHTPHTGVQGTEHRVAVTVRQTHVPIIPVKTAPDPQPHVVRASSHSDVFERAMHHATSHQQPEHKRRKHHRLANTFAGIAVFLVLGGFIAYLNMPNIELHVASVQAGFKASMPSYTPTGYALSGHVKHAGGTISMRFTSGDSNYTLTQQASDWNSQTLLDSTLALSGAHQTIQKNGETIYIYGDGASAAWVNGGVRYDMTGNATLNAKEIVSIATSL